MLGLRFSRLVHASLAGGSLVLGGCANRAYDFGDASGGGDADSTGTTDGPHTVTITDPTVGPTTTPPNPTSPTDPTVDPTDPTGIPPEMPGPPQLIAAAFLDNLTLSLTFSEPLAPPQSVDPRQFRLSTAYAPKGNYYYQYNTYYQEVGNWNGACDEYCYEYCYDTGCYEQCWDYCQPGPPVRVAVVSQPAERPDMLVLSLDNGIGSGVCSQLENFPEQWSKGLFIHYTPAGNAPVTDIAGELLGDIAEHWALQPDRQWAYNQGTFPFMEPVIPIPCPF
jgi:hypothetical protein